MRNSDMPAVPAGKDVESVFGRRLLGLSKREHYAGLAMQGFCAFHGDGQDFDVTAKEAVDMADLLLAELEKIK